MSKVQFMDQLLRDFREVSAVQNKSSVNESFLKEESTGPQIILTNNKNRLKLKEYSKKLSHYKQEMVNVSNQIDLEYARFKESKISMATIITREINKLQKQDEDQIKEMLTFVRKLIEFNQKITLEIENVFENQQTVSVQEVEAAAQVFQEVEQQVLALKEKRLDLGSMDFKLLSMNEYNRMTLQLQEQKLNSQEQQNNLFRNEQKINLMLSQQLEEKNQIIQQLQNNSSWEQWRDLEQMIFNQLERFRIPQPKSNGNLFNYVFDHLDQMLYNQECEIKDLQNQIFKYQKEIDEIKQENEIIIKENKQIQNQVKQRIDEKHNEKLQLQDEMKNILNNSIEIEKENQVYNNQLQIAIRICIRNYRNTRMMWMNQMTSELNQRINVKNIYQSLNRLNKQNNELESILYQSKNDESDEIKQYIQLSKSQSSRIQQLETELNSTQLQHSKLLDQQKESDNLLKQLRDQVQDLQKQISCQETEIKKQLKLNDVLQKQLKESYELSNTQNSDLREIDEDIKYQIKYNEIQKEYKEYKVQTENRLKKVLTQSQELQQKVQIQDQEKLLESHKMIEKETTLKSENQILNQKINLLQEQLKQQELNYLNEIKVTKLALDQTQLQYQQQSQLFDKLKLQASQLEQAVLEKEALIQELQQELDSNSAQYEQQANEVQLEYNSIIEEKQSQNQQFQQTISNQKHEIMLLQRQIDQLEFQKQQDLLQYKIENDKKSLQFAKELEQVKDVLNSSMSFQQIKESEKSFQKKMQQVQETSNKSIVQTQQKYEQIIQDLVQQYDKQINYLQDQLNLQNRLDYQQTRNSQKPPRAQHKSPNCYTNSPASSIQQSFYREVAKFSKDLDDSQESNTQKRPTGIIKKNKHIFIEDDNNTSQEQASSVQNYSSSGRAQITDHAVQTEQQNEDIFPPFDHRICLRCKKNDMIAPNFCKFKEVNQFTDLSNSQGSASRLKSSRVLKEHIYGSNLSWRQRETNSVTKSNYFSIGEKTSQGVNTILSLVNIESTQIKRASSQRRNKRNSESLSISFSSKMDTNRSNQ
ncbi:unnamed protein product (macronuclear) [Paramecium tetraurelia]|uniref:Uncharacterized protein n=1 Tax=Paramecium tetraurelia TaxID=5888 RepID=A0D6W1_PARTE|nr:uncharacterized protein GSPATT00001819001 [Paramecium tetraurelia]CAK78778.1 unnamed protein product [Paramecium tetraurelia]|eukprot:XP_001446175.1 hypothetical protein (macronuclear) [Paramecium tetraurelia strain d4-2]